MILHIDTTKNDLVAIAVKDKNRLIAETSFNSRRTQAEKLLPAIEKLLKTNKLKLSNLGGIAVENIGGSFTSLRLGVITANALAYALGILVAGSKKSEVRSKKGSFSVVKPIYDREPEITKKKGAPRNDKAGLWIKLLITVK